MNARGEGLYVIFYFLLLCLPRALRSSMVIIELSYGSLSFHGVQTHILLPNQVKRPTSTDWPIWFFIYSCGAFTILANNFFLFSNRLIIFWFTVRFSSSLFGLVTISIDFILNLLISSTMQKSSSISLTPGW